MKYIEKEWRQELERLQKYDLYVTNLKKVPGLKEEKQAKALKCLTESGHAELENGSALFVFGNALEVLERE